MTPELAHRSGTRMPTLFAALCCAATMAAQAAPTITVTGRDAVMGATNFSGGAGTEPARVPGDGLITQALTPATLSLVGSDSNAIDSLPFRNSLEATWNLTQTFSASADTLSASGHMDVFSAGQACVLAACTAFDGGGTVNNRQTLYFSVSEDTPYVASGSSGSQQIISVDVWTGAAWASYVGLTGAWDRVATYNFGLDGAAPVDWTFANTFRAGSYRIYNTDDFYVGRTDLGWSYSIQFTAPGATVSAVPEPGTLALALAGLGVLLGVRRRA